MPFQTIISDECTRIANPKSKTGYALKSLVANHKIALTGTLISNKPQDVWNVVDWIAPKAFGNFFQFLNRYTVKDFWGSVEGYVNLDELAEKLKPYMIRRTKEQCLPELPLLITEIIPFKLSDKEMKLYDQLKKELLFDIEKAQVSKVSELVTVQQTLVKMVRLRQLCDSMELLGDDTTSTKMEVLKELLILDGLAERKVIIFTEFSKMADIIARELNTPLKITGSVSSEERQTILDEFNTPESQQKYLVMTNAGAYGLNVQIASVVIHVDQPWSLGKLTQRVGRAHRMGQEKSVLEYSLVARGTLDSYMVKKIENKQVISDRIMLSEVKEMLNG